MSRGGPIRKFREGWAAFAGVGERAHCSALIKNRLSTNLDPQKLFALLFYATLLVLAALFALGVDLPDFAKGAIAGGLIFHSWKEICTWWRF